MMLKEKNCAGEFKDKKKRVKTKFSNRTKVQIKNSFRV